MNKWNKNYIFGVFTENRECPRLFTASPAPRRTTNSWCMSDRSRTFFTKWRPRQRFGEPPRTNESFAREEKLWKTGWSGRHVAIITRYTLKYPFLIERKTGTKRKRRREPNNRLGAIKFEGGERVSPVTLRCKWGAVVSLFIARCYHLLRRIPFIHAGCSLAYPTSFQNFHHLFASSSFSVPSLGSVVKNIQGWNTTKTFDSDAYSIYKCKFTDRSSVADA